MWDVYHSMKSLPIYSKSVSGWRIFIGMVVLLQSGSPVSVWKVCYWMGGWVLVSRVSFFMEDYAGNGGIVFV